MNTLIGTGIVLLTIVGGFLTFYLVGCLLVWEKPFHDKDYYFESGEKLGLGFAVTALALLVVFVGYHVGNYEPAEEPNPVKYDYMIELQGDSLCGDIIKISEDGIGWHIIHPDSLEEFIEKDNL